MLPQSWKPMPPFVSPSATSSDLRLQELGPLPVDRYGHLYDCDDDRETAVMDALISRADAEKPSSS
jgi:hypothetical protein